MHPAYPDGTEPEMLVECWYNDLSFESGLWLDGFCFRAYGPDGDGIFHCEQIPDVGAFLSNLKINMETLLRYIDGMDC